MSDIPDTIGYQDEEGNVVIRRNCVKCKAPQEIRVTREDFLRWQKEHVLIQQAFPYLTPGQREMFLSGVCEKCWDEMFGEEE